MAQIPGLPTNDPVAKPDAKPSLFGIGGDTVAQLGQETQQLAQANAEFEGQLNAAHRQLKYKQIEVNIGRLESQAHDDLRKTVTPEEAQDVHTHFKQQVIDTLGPYESDRALAPHLNLYSQQVDVEMQNTVNARKATILVDGDHEANKTLIKDNVQQSINAMAAGGNDKVLRDALDAKLESSVHVIGSMLPQEKEELMRERDQAVQAGYIEAQLGSTNLQTVQDTVNDIQLHPEKYPNLDKAQLNAFVEKGESAIVSRMSRQKEINASTEEAKYWNESPSGIPKMFTDVNGNFDQGKAESYVAGLGLSPEGERQLLSDVKTHGAAANHELKASSVKMENDIVATLSSKQPDYKKADEMLNQYKAFTEQHPEFGDAFKSLKTYEYAQQEHAKSEAIYERGVHNEEVRAKREQEQQDSFDLLGQLGPAIQRGEYSDTQLRSMAGKGKGKLLPAQVNEAIALSHSMETDPENKPYINSIWNDTAIPTAVQGNVITEFHDWLRKNPNASGDQKAAEVKRLTDPSKIEQINNRLDQINDRMNGASPVEQQKPEISLPEDYASGVPESQPAVGTVKKGYKFTGGDASKRENWQRVQ